MTEKRIEGGKKGKGRLSIPLPVDAETLAGLSRDFPKYTTQIMNLANQTAQGTRPRVVGQMSELIVESNAGTYEDWVKWYTRRMPNAIEDATAKVWGQVQKYVEAGQSIDQEMVRAWVKDLVLTKTYTGLGIQLAVLQAVSRETGLAPIRPAAREDESRGIDGYLASQPVSVKPETYGFKAMVLPEKIEVPVIYYWEEGGLLVVDYSQLLAAL